jgi:hypothetical protein
MNEKFSTQTAFERDYPVRRLLILISDAWTPIVFIAFQMGKTV